MMIMALKKYDLKFLKCHFKKYECICHFLKHMNLLSSELENLKFGE